MTVPKGQAVYDIDPSTGLWVGAPPSATGQAAANALLTAINSALNPVYKSVAISQAGSTTDIIAAVAAKRFCVVSYEVVCSADGTFKFTEKTSAIDLTGAMDLKANNGVSAGGPAVFVTPTPNRALQCISTGAVRGVLCYYEIT